MIYVDVLPDPETLPRGTYVRQGTGGGRGRTAIVYCVVYSNNLGRNVHKFAYHADSLSKHCPACGSVTFGDCHGK